jgi:hypothetical protein
MLKNKPTHHACSSLSKKSMSFSELLDEITGCSAVISSVKYAFSNKKVLTREPQVY